jgi:shikimate kinase
MGAGKTTAAKRIANRLGWEVADTDDLFEEKYRISVHDFFHKYDETLFRKLESEVLKSTENMEYTVISTGGGLACFLDNMEWMNQHGLTVFMHISPEAAADRILHSKRKRPLTENKTEAELAEYIQQHYASRLPFYEQAQITVKSENFDLDNLIQLIENEKDN